jgi:hypothetical protein
MVMLAREVTNDQIEAMSQDERHAWAASMDGDESIVLHWPAGRWHELLLAAYFKRALLSVQMTADERLRLLEFLAGLSDGTCFTPRVVAAVRPASDAMMRIIHEARALDPEDDPAGRASFDMLTSWECRWQILKVQPSLLNALRLSPSAVWDRQRTKKPVTN